MCMHTDICYIDKDKRYVQHDVKQNFGLHRKRVGFLTQKTEHGFNVSEGGMSRHITRVDIDKSGKKYTSMPGKELPINHA